MVRLEKRKIVYLFTAFLVLILLFICTRNGISDQAPVFTDIYIIGAGTVVFIFLLYRSVTCQLEAGVWFIGYFARIACLFFDVYGKSIYTLPFSGGDTETFYNWASELYNYGHMPIENEYAGTIYALYQFVGENRLLAQYFNIVCWIGTMMILVQLGKRYALTSKNKTWLAVIWSFLPTGIMLSSILLRESLEVLFAMWSFYVFLEWMEHGKKKMFLWAFVLSVPAIILHSASIALWVAYLAVWAIYDVNQKLFSVKLKTVVVFFAVLIGLPGCMAIMPVIFPAWRFPVSFSVEQITHLVEFDLSDTSSVYLADMQCSGWGQFIVCTVIRMFYFMFSPLPTEAKGMMDLVSFFLDGFLIFVVMMVLVSDLFKKRGNRMNLCAAFMAMAVYAGVFAWGVAHAGTAIRHRYLVWGIAVIGLSNGWAKRKIGK